MASFYLDGVVKSPWYFINSRIPGVGKQKIPAACIWGCSRLNYYLTNIHSLSPRPPTHPWLLESSMLPPPIAFGLGHVTYHDQWNASGDASSKGLKCACALGFGILPNPRKPAKCEQEGSAYCGVLLSLRWFVTCILLWQELMSTKEFWFKDFLWALIWEL